MHARPAVDVYDQRMLAVDAHRFRQAVIKSLTVFCVDGADGRRAVCRQVSVIGVRDVRDFLRNEIHPAGCRVEDRDPAHVGEARHAIEYPAAVLGDDSFVPACIGADPLHLTAGQ